MYLYCYLSTQRGCLTREKKWY